MTNTTIVNNLYPIANATSSSNAFVDHFATRDPTPNDVNFPIQKKWLNTTTNSFWELKNFVTSQGIVTANWIVIGSSSLIEALEGNSGGPVFPDASNVIHVVGDGTTINVVGTPLSNTLTISSLVVATDLHTAKFIVGDLSNGANFATIAAAITAAVSGDTIFIQTGTYTENLTLKAGVNLTAFACDAANSDFIVAPANNVTIIGKITASYSGLVNISDIFLQTNSDFAIVLSSASATLNVTGCYLNAVNNTFISMTAAGKMTIENCNGNLGTTGIAWFAQTAGTLNFNHCIFINGGSSTTPSTSANAVVLINYSDFTNPIALSGSAFLQSLYVVFNGIGNTTNISLTGTSSMIGDYCRFDSGTASTISIGAGTAVSLFHARIDSSNTNAITGAGTLNYGTLDFTSTSKTINPTTQNYVNGAGFTPAIAFGGASTGITYVDQLGEYSRIGNIVFFNIVITLSSKGSATGAASITGFPIATLAVLEQVNGIAETGSITYDANFTNSFLNTGGTSGTNFFLFEFGATAGNQALTNTNFNNNSQIKMSGFYFLS